VLVTLGVLVVASWYASAAFVALAEASARRYGPGCPWYDAGVALAFAVGAVGGAAAIAVGRRRGGPAGLGVAVVALAAAMLVHQVGSAWTEGGELRCGTVPIHPPLLWF
jgi:hypothetical protein